jgi:hypothetical protein
MRAVHLGMMELEGDGERGLQPAFAVTTPCQEGIGEEADFLKVSRRTLQEYRNDGILPYIEMRGKCVYKESDIEKVLKRNYRRF